MLADVQFTEAEATELRGKGIDVLAGQIIENSIPRSQSNDPRDLEEALRPQREAEEKAKAEAEAKAAEEAKAREDAKAKAEQRKQQRLQARMDELTRERHEAARKLEAEAAARRTLEDEIRQLREQVANPNRPAPLAEPKREDYDDTDAYVAARVKFETETALRKKDEEAAAAAAKAAAEKAEADKAEAEKREKAEAERRAQGNVQALAERFEAQKAEARKQFADYDAVTGKSDIVLSPQLAMATLQDDRGAFLVYHFGQHPELVKELNGLDQASMLEKLDQIELSLPAAPGAAAAATDDKPGAAATDTTGPAGNGAGDQPRGPDGQFVAAKDVSSASAPITPVSQSGEGAGLKSPEDLTVAEYIAARESGKLK